MSSSRDSEGHGELDRDQQPMGLTASTREPEQSQRSTDASATTASPVSPEAGQGERDTDTGKQTVSNQLHRWWLAHRGELARDGVVGIVLFIGALLWDDRLADRAEVLENTRFVRQVAIENVSGKPFAGLNLHDAQLSALNLGCESNPNRRACGDFAKARLSDADLSRTNLSGADLRNANLSGADLGDAYLGGADLGEANLSGADLRNANLGGADLGDAYLGGADLGDANLEGADLRGANLGDAYLGGADLGDANLEGADLSGADLSGALFLHQWQIEVTQGDRFTRLPAGLQNPSRWR